MPSRITDEIAKLYTKRHEYREGFYGDKPYANFGYWDQENMTLPEACDALTNLVAVAAKLGPGDRVLEVGCGYGAGAVYYTQLYRPASVIGIDATEIRIQTGREYIARHGLADTVQIRLGDATALDFEPSSFTKVLAIECAFHFDTRVDFFRECARVLAPGGTLALTDVIPKKGVDPKQFLRPTPPLGGDISLDIPANAYDADVYAAHLHDARFNEVRIESICDRTRVRFADHLESLGRQLGGDKGNNLLKLVERNRAHIAAGADYILVTATREKDEDAG
jgi:cyclopropane fatty-acyl-phospholipid synthase-like methyltransferase